MGSENRADRRAVEAQETTPSWGRRKKSDSIQGIGLFLLPEERTMYGKNEGSCQEKEKQRAWRFGGYEEICAASISLK